jgi:hypothetical protein
VPIGEIGVEIRNVEETREVTLRDIDIALMGGDKFSLTLRSGDTFMALADSLHVTYGASGEKVTIFLDKVLWMSERSRTVEEKLPEKAKGGIAA